MGEKLDPDKNVTRRNVLKGVIAAGVTAAGIDTSKANLGPKESQNTTLPKRRTDIDLFKLEDEKRWYTEFISKERAALGEVLSANFDLIDVETFYAAVEEYAIQCAKQKNSSVGEGIARYQDMERYVFQVLRAIPKFPADEMSDSFIRLALSILSQDAMAILEKQGK